MDFIPHSPNLFLSPYFLSFYQISHNSETYNYNNKHNVIMSLIIFFLKNNITVFEILFILIFIK